MTNFSDDKTNNSFKRIIQTAPIGMLSFSGDWRIQYVNDNFSQFAILYNLNLTVSPGSNILENKIFPDADLTGEFEKLKEGLAFEKEIKSIKTSDGKISVFLKATPLFENNEFAGGILIIEDLKLVEKKEQKELTANDFEKIAVKTNDFLFITDSEGIVKHAFGKTLRKLKFSFDDPEEHHITVNFSTQSSTDFSEKLAVVKNKRSSEELTVEMLFENKIKYFICRLLPLVNKSGQIDFVFVSLNDISGFIKKEDSLKEELSGLKQYKFLIDNISDAIFTVGKQGNILFWNHASEILFGYNSSEILNKFLGNLFDHFDEEYFESIKHELHSSTIWENNISAITKNGNSKNVHVKFILSGNSDNSIIIYCSDITEKIKKEKRLKSSEEMFRNLFSNTDELICVVNISGNIIYTNKKFNETLKFSEEEVKNRNIKNFIESNYLRDNSFDLNDFIQKTGRINIPFISKTGREFLFSSSITPVYNEKNNLEYFNCFFLDITSEKNIAEEFHLLNALFESSFDGIILESKGKILKANAAFANIFGYEKPDELIDKEILNLSSSSDVLKMAEYLQLIRQKKSVPPRFDFLAKRNDRSNFFAEVSSSFFEMEKKNYSVMIFRDITGRKKAQQQIKESEEKYRNITENIDDFLYTFERVKAILRPVFYTISVEKITGYKYQDFLNDTRLYLKIIHPDDFPLVKNILKRLLKSKIQLSEEFEFRIINKHGNVAWVRNKINLIRNEEGKIQKIYGLVSDISTRKKAEKDLIKSTEKLVKNNETKDKFISIVSHDLRTPFSSILGFTDLLLNDPELSEKEKKQYIKYIQDSSQSMLALVNSLLDWTRLQTGRIKFEPDRIAAADIIEKSINSISGTAFQKNIKIQLNVKDDLFIFVDKDLIGQVFNNLISNAIKFTNENGNITLSSKPSEKLRFVEFSVKDNGIGIKEENLNRLFKVETKFSSEGTKGEKGSGLGLSLIKEIIEKHGGKIWVESEYKKGSEFKFTLPVASADILLVDDSRTDKLLYSKILMNITPDYNVETASSAKEALEKIKDAPPALIITDHQMPKMNGYEFVIEILKSDMKIKPPIIVLSSDIDRSAIQDYTRLGIEFVFQKPVNLSIFKQAVEKSLKKGLTGI